MGESVKYIHHCIGSTIDPDRLPGDNGPRVAGNRRVVATADDRTGQAVSGGRVLADHGQAYTSNRFRSVQLPTVVEELSTRPRIPLAMRGELNDEMIRARASCQGPYPVWGTPAALFAADRCSCGGAPGSRMGR